MSALLSTFDDDTTVNAMALTLLLDFTDIAQAPEVECHLKDVQLKAQFKNASYRALVTVCSGLRVMPCRAFWRSIRKGVAPTLKPFKCRKPLKW